MQPDDFSEAARGGSNKEEVTVELQLESSGRGGYSGAADLWWQQQQQ